MQQQKVLQKIQQTEQKISSSLSVNQQKQNKSLNHQAAKAKLKQAYDHFHKNQYDKSLQIYTSIIQQQDAKSELKLQALQNRMSLHLTKKQYNNAIEDYNIYSKLNSPNPNPPELYILHITTLLKWNKPSQACKISEQAIKIYPYQKKLKQLSKLCKEKLISSEQELYVESIYEKLCTHPQIREYLKDESFLTKVERVIRNPSLASAMEKMDPRIREVADFIMMAEDDEESR